MPGVGRLSSPNPTANLVSVLGEATIANTEGTVYFTVPWEAASGVYSPCAASLFLRRWRRFSCFLFSKRRRN